MANSNVTTALVVAVVAVIVDLGSKYAMTGFFNLELGESRTIIPGFVNFILSKNTGINFGLFANGSAVVKLLLAALAVIVSLALLYTAWRRPPSWLLAVGVGLFVGGALGNAFDRVVYGAVTDFLNVTCCGINNPFAFNMADVWIFVGLILIMIRTSSD